MGHLSLNKDAPEAREISSEQVGTNRSDPTGGRTSSSLRTPGRLVIHARRSVRSGRSGSASVEFPSGRTRKCIVGLPHTKRSAPAKFRTKTKANSEQRHFSILFCLRPISLPTEYWRCTAAWLLGGLRYWWENQWEKHQYK